MLNQINKAYSALATFRRDRERLKNFTFGRQWDDTFVTPEHQVSTEGQYAHSRGRSPMTNNMIHRLVKTLIGHFRSQVEQVSRPATPPAQATQPQEVCRQVKSTAPDHNALDELDARMFEEFLISGAAIQRIAHEHRPGFDGVRPWVDNVSPNDFFAYPLRDPRALDVELIGMFHTWSIDEVIGRLGGGSRQRAAELRSIVKARTQEPAGFEHCRIIEVWHRESQDFIRVFDPENKSTRSLPADKQSDIATENRRRRRKGKPRLSTRFELQSQWVGRFYTADGLLLHTVAAPSHPFAVKFYPLLDGEIHSFVSSIVDQQKYINRLITLIDTMMACSAKGVLLFPEKERSETTTWERIGELWADFNTVIPYKHDAGSPGPHQVVTNTSQFGAYDLLNLQLRLFDEIGGVSQALKGEAAGNSAQLYDAQLQNSLAAISDIFAAFQSFRTARNNKVEQLSRAATPALLAP